jgi:glucose-6-phosphate dehydrogenase assembly protein OpcA
MSTDIETLTPDELEQLRACALGEEVALGALESKLQQYWDREDAATRASLTNFAIYNERIGALVRNTALISEITKEHACRALLIMCLPAKEQPRVRAWITAHCRLDAEGRKEACSEQVAFLVESDSPDLIRNIVFSHLDSDLPLVLWWQGDFTARFEEHLYTSIDRLIIDSDETSDLDAFCRTIIGAIEDDKSRFTVHDLAWTRSFQCRLAMAAVFDDPAARKSMHGSRSVRIRHSPENRSTALFTLAWLATQSSWSIRPPSGAAAAGTVSLEDGLGNEITASVESEVGSEPLSELGLEGPGFSLSIRRDPAARYLKTTWSVDGGERHQMFPAGSNEDAELVTEQLMRGGRNRLFGKVIPAYRQLIAEG